MPDSQTPETVPFEKARECPECGHPGKVRYSNAIVGGTLHTMQCDNQVCPWYQTGWLVETDSNGEVRVNQKAMESANAERLVAPKDPNFDAAFEGIHKMLSRQIDEETERK